MRNLFRDHILVAEALRCNAEEYREIYVHCVRTTRIDVSELQAYHSVHAPFCMGVNKESPFPPLYSSHLRLLMHNFMKTNEMKAYDTEAVYGNY